jgi:hypothetical protein
MKKYVLIAVILFFAGCTAMPQKLSMPVVPESVQELGYGSCKKCSFILIGVIPIKFNSMTSRAYECAVKEEEGDALINPEIKESYYWIPYAGQIFCTTVSGTVIRKKDINLPRQAY